MIPFTGRRLPGGLLLVPLVVLFAGCNQRAATPGTATSQTARPVSTEPGAIELSDPKVTFEEPNRIRFEVHYKFTKGGPEKYYLCEVTFPGTANVGAKSMESWELKPEGVIKDGIILTKPPVKTFEIRVSEANSPDEGYKLISNVATGEVK
ncbi:MAG TPA: hypothetical protein VFG68_20440 [Fimbriiglobus sp.]|nr:hypothetical protein [Fimbriiglobus sp.]